MVMVTVYIVSAFCATVQLVSPTGFAAIRVTHNADTKQIPLLTSAIWHTFHQ